MKIALIDNMNNNFFAMARYLRDLGMDAHVFCLPSAYAHFTPQADTFLDVKQLDFVHELSFNPSAKTFLFKNKHRFKPLLKNFDFIMACGHSLAYLARENITVDMVIPYGSDLYKLTWAKPATLSLKSLLTSLALMPFAPKQRQCLQTARLVISDSSYQLYGDSLKKLGIKALYPGIPFVYNGETQVPKEEDQDWQVLKQHDFVVFNHARQYWHSNIDNVADFKQYLGLKRNDKLIKAFAQFIKQTQYQSPCLVLFEYGPDVKQSKALVRELGITSNVRWYQTTCRRDIMLGLKYANLTSNAFRENTIDIGGVVYECLAAGIPHLNYCQDVLEDKTHRFYQSPMISVLSIEGILNVFKDYERHKGKYLNIATLSKAWFDEHLGIGLASRYKTLIEKMVKDKRVNILTHKDEMAEVLCA